MEDKTRFYPSGIDRMVKIRWYTLEWSQTECDFAKTIPKKLLVNSQHGLSDVIEKGKSFQNKSKLLHFDNTLQTNAFSNK